MGLLRFICRPDRRIKNRTNSRDCLSDACISRHTNVQACDAINKRLKKHPHFAVTTALNAELHF